MSSNAMPHYNGPYVILMIHLSCTCSRGKPIWEILVNHVMYISCKIGNVRYLYYYIIQHDKSPITIFILGYLFLWNCEIFGLKLKFNLAYLFSFQENEF